MTATIKTTENLDKRQIEGVVSVDDEGREFYVSVSHYGPRKAYMATFGRRIRTEYGYREVLSMRAGEEKPGQQDPHDPDGSLLGESAPRGVRKD